MFINPDRAPKELDAFNTLRAQILKRENNGEKDLVIRNGEIMNKTNGQ